MTQSWVSGLFGAVIAGLFWLVYSLTGNIGGTIGICLVVFIGVNATSYAIARKRKH